MGTKRYQGAGGNTGGRPEHGHAIGLGQQRKTKPRPQEVGDPNRQSDTDRRPYRREQSAAICREKWISSFQVQFSWEVARIVGCAKRPKCLSAVL